MEKKVLLELHSFDDLKSIIVENNSIHCHFNFNWYASGIPYHHGNKFTKIRNPCIVGMIQIVPPWSASATLIDKSNKSWFRWRWNACPCHNEASFNHLVIMMMILILMMVIMIMMISLMTASTTWPSASTFPPWASPNNWTESPFWSTAAARPLIMISIIIKRIIMIAIMIIMLKNLPKANPLGQLPAKGTSWLLHWNMMHANNNKDYH